MSMSSRYPSLPYLPPILMLAGLFFVAGCSDMVSLESTERDAFGPETAVRTSQVDGRDVTAWGRSIQARSKKARHFSLLDRAIVSTDARKIIAGSDSVRLLLGTRAGAASDPALEAVLDKYKIFNRFEYRSALRGVAVTMPAAQVDSFMADADALSAVSSIEPDAEMSYGAGADGTVTATSQEIPWAIRNSGADRSSTLAGNGGGAVDVDLYVLDTGVESSDVNVVECLEFTRRREPVPCTSASDADGHGTGVALAAAARDDQSGIVGVAPGARVHAIKALREKGNTPLSVLVAVVDFLTERKLADPSVPMVVNISMGADVKTTRYNALDEAIEASIAAGVVYVLAAGNNATSAENVSPAHVAEAITVGAHDAAGRFSSFSNHGPVLDILAPGEDVLTMTTRNELSHTSGTSLAAPFVAGAAALLLSQEPSLTPAQVRDRIVEHAQATVTGMPSETTDKALFVNW